MEFKKREIKKPESGVVTPELETKKATEHTEPQDQNIVVQVRSELFEYRSLQSLALAFEHTFTATNYQQAGRYAIFVYSMKEVGEPGKVVQFWNNALRSVNKQAYYSMHKQPVPLPKVVEQPEVDPPEVTQGGKAGGCSSCAEKAKARKAQREKEKAALEAAAKADQESKANKVENEQV